MRMQTIRKELSILLLMSTLTAILLTAFFVNLTVNNKFNEYMVESQNKRYQRIVNYFEEVYKRDRDWTKDSGIEITHEAYMSNFCITLMDRDKKVIWGMAPNDIKHKMHLDTMYTSNQGVYTTKTYSIYSKGNIVGYLNIGQYSSVLLTEEDLNFKVSINKSLMLSSIVTFIIFISISLYIGKKFSTPIKEVAEMSVNLSKGQFYTRSQIRTNIEELENLRNSINTLAEKLSNQDMLRKRLVSDISHEIRTPLNVLQNNLEAMIDGIFPVTTEALESLNDEVIRFAKLLDHLNVLKEFEEESTALNFQPILLEDFLSKVCKDFEVAAAEKNINLIYSKDEKTSAYILGNKDHLRQVFINLLSNAIKFTMKGGRVEVKLYSNFTNVLIEIIDSGIGISKEDLPYIFERMYRGDKSRQMIEGKGIGLTIVKKILQQHSAVIDVKSKKGKGTAIKISFKRLESIKETN